MPVPHTKTVAAERQTSRACEPQAAASQQAETRCGTTAAGNAPTQGAGARQAQQAPRWLERVPFQFAAFVIAGALAAAVNIGSRIVLSFAVSYEIAIVVAYGIGMVVAFLIMRAFVFQPSTRLSRGSEFGRFVIVNILGVAQTLVVSVLIARWVAPSLGFAHHAEEIGHVIGVGVPVFTSFVGHKYFSFRKTKLPQSAL